MKVQDDRNTLLLIGLCFVKNEVHPEEGQDVTCDGQNAEG